MKQYAKQKWVLSALLITALGSQYYFSANSNHLNTTDLSSEAEVAAIRDAAAILSAPATPSSVSVPAAPSTPSAPAAPVTRTESAAPTVPCPECVVLSRADAEKIRKVLQDVVAQKTAEAAPAAPAAPPESALDRARRLREEAADARRDAAQAKADKIRDEKLMRNEEFKDKMDEAADRCNGDVSCVASRYTSLLSRYSGRRKIDMSVATAAYIKYVQPGLKAAVGIDGNDALAQETLRTIGMDIPAEYRSIKEASVNDIKAVAQERAVATNNDFRQADRLGKEKRYDESQQYFAQATQESRDFQSDMRLYQNTMRDSYADDPASLAFMQRNFMPEVSRLFDNLNNLDGLSMATSGTAASGSRNARGSGTPVATTTIDNGKLSLPSTSNTSEITFGSPVAGQRNTRGRN